MRYCFLILSLFLNFFVFSDIVIPTQQTVILNYLSDEWIIALDDQSYWKLNPIPTKRRRTFCEWWHSSIPKEWLVTDEFIFDPQSWGNEFQVNVYETKQSIFLGYTHIIENTKTGQKVFAKFIPFGTESIPKLEYAKKLMNYQICQSKIGINLCYIGNSISLDDETIWEFFPVKAKTQSWKQWWYNIRPVQPDKPFIFNSWEWVQGDQVNVYYYDAALTETHLKYDPKARKAGMYLIENASKNLLVYARPLTFAEFIAKQRAYTYAQERKAYNSGFGSGYWNGYNQGYNNGSRR